MQYERHNAWSVLLRLFHWGFALSIVVLVTTGFYIHYPWTNTMIEGGGNFPVATMRYIHFIAAFVFTASLLARLYLLFFGNKQERLWDFLPVTGKNIKNLLSSLTFYAYLSDKNEHRLGHNSLAGLVYFITFIVAGAQLISGFYLLYPESSAWQEWGLRFFGTQQEARLTHYFIMWYFLCYSVIHVYIAVWNDINTKEGLISSIFNGIKYKPKKI